VLVGPAAKQSCEVASHVSRRGVDSAAAGRYDFGVGYGLGAGGPYLVSGRQTSLDSVGSEKVGVAHAEGFEEVLVKVAVEGFLAHVLDDLAERGERVIGVDVSGAGLNRETEASAVVLGKGRHRLSELHHLAEDRLEHP
jgi:hypothetical protein